MRAFIVIFLATLGLPAFAVDPVLTADPTCHIDSPPADAGEGADHAQLFKVYPRKSALGAQFNGCQNFWLYARGTDGLSHAPVDFARFYFVQGKVVAARIGGVICRYSKAGTPAADNGAACSGAAPEAMPSQPAGCMTASRAQSGESCVDDE